MPNQEVSTPFIIEWIPDILPTMHIGELRIKFEYGHQRNGSIEHRNNPTTSIISVVKPDSTLPVLMPAVPTEDIISNIQLEGSNL